MGGVRGPRAAAALAALALPSAAVAQTAPRPDPLPNQYPGPLSPVLESRGAKVVAQGSSFCWSTRFVDGSGAGFCADLFPPRPIPPKDMLPVRGYRVIEIDMGMPTEAVTASLDRRPLTSLVRQDPLGRHWRLRLPLRLSRPTSTLSLGATYAQGGRGYTAGLRRVRR
jgi:hypothetical protein